MWVVIAAITGIAVWFLVNALGGGGVETPAVADDRETQAPEPTEEPGTEPVVATETPTPVETEDVPDDEVRLITEGISVQVLNGTLQPDAGETMSGRLSDLGYTVVAVEESSQAYADTTVFWSTPEAEEAARALADRFGWVAEPKPENLSPEVSLHVVVGADEA
jgi:hypothetical protein